MKDQTDPFDIFGIWSDHIPPSESTFCPRCAEEVCPACRHCACTQNQLIREQDEAQHLRQQLGEAQQVLERALGYHATARTSGIVAVLARQAVARMHAAEQQLEEPSKKKSGEGKQQ